MARRKLDPPPRRRPRTTKRPATGASKPSVPERPKPAATKRPKPAATKRAKRAPEGGRKRAAPRRRRLPRLRAPRLPRLRAGGLPGASLLLSARGWPLLFAVPFALAIALRLADASDTAVFFLAAAGAIAPAALLGRVGAELSARAAAGIAPLIYVALGSAPLLVIGLFAVEAGLHEVVKAALAGSVIVGALLMLGVAMIAAAPEQRKERDRTGVNAQASILLLAGAAMLVPALVALVRGDGLPSIEAELIDYGQRVEFLSAAVAGVLLAALLGGLFLSPRGERGPFDPPVGAPGRRGRRQGRRMAIGFVAGLAGIAIMAEIIAGTLEGASAATGLSHFFVGAVVVAVAASASRWDVVAAAARGGGIAAALEVSIGSATQVALLAAPVLVLASFALGPVPMALVLNGLALGGVLVAALVVSRFAQAGAWSRYEGLLLLALYAVLALGFYFA